MPKSFEKMCCERMLKTEGDPDEMAAMTQDLVHALAAVLSIGTMGKPAIRAKLIEGTVHYLYETVTTVSKEVDEEMTENSK